MGLTHADAGTMSLLGYPVPKHRDLALARVGAIVDEPRFHGHLTGRQNLQILAAAREPAARDRIGPALERVGILHRADDKVSKYSMGMRQRLGVAACLIGDPELLILDEPMNGLDPAGMADMREMIISLVAEGRTVVLSSHLLDEVERTCDAVAIVDKGKVVRQGPISELLAGASLALQVECSEPDRARSSHRRHSHRGPHRGRVSGPRRQLAGRDDPRCHRRDQPCPGGRWNLGVSAPGDPGVARIVVPAGHKSTGGPGMRTPAHTTATVRQTLPADVVRDHRGSPIPTGAMIATRFMELRRRRGLMIALIVVNIGIPTVFLVVRLLAHAIAPKSYGPAGGYSIFTNLVAGVMYVFGFIVAATLGCAAGSVDLTEGMFRHLVVTGRSRLALYLARIPAGLAIVIAMVAVGYTIVCAVCVFAAPTQLNYDGVNVPQGLSRPALDSWAASHADEVICNFNYNGGQGLIGPPPSVPCGNGQTSGPPPGAIIKTPKGTITVPASESPAQIRAFAVAVANQDYSDYRSNFLVPPIPLMVEVGLWIALEATIGFIVGLGLASLMGQRTVPVILLIVLELILTPIFSRHIITHLVNLERGVVGVAMVHIEPGGLPTPFGGGGPGGGGVGGLIPESTLAASLVIVGWLVFWTAIGAWRMMTRDA